MTEALDFPRLLFLAAVALFIAFMLLSELAERPRRR